MLDVNKTVSFKNWDEDCRSKDEVRELQETCTSITDGKIVGKEEGSYLVEWRTPLGVFRSFHYIDELEEIILCVNCGKTIVDKLLGEQNPPKCLDCIELERRAAEEHLEKEMEEHRRKEVELERERLQKVGKATELNEPLTKPAAINWDSSEVKVGWLKENGYKFFHADEGDYFVDKRGIRSTVQEISDRYNTHVISQQVFPRLAILASFDEDMAREENGVGFNKLDTAPGHSLVEWYKEKGFWTSGQLLFAIKIQHKYKNQLKKFMGERYQDITTWRGIKYFNKTTNTWEAFPETMLDQLEEKDGESK